VFLLRFDLRIPPFVAGLTPADQYREFLEMIRWADQRGFAAVVLSEPHGTEDGYMSAPLVLAGAVLGATRNLFCSVSALLLPLQDPLRAAEDIAALDRLAPGRLKVVVGVGYRVEDCAAALEAVVAAGGRAIDDAPRPGSRGTTVAFVHPKGSFGTLIELVEEPPGG